MGSQTVGWYTPQRLVVKVGLGREEEKGQQRWLLLRDIWDSPQGRAAWEGGEGAQVGASPRGRQVLDRKVVYQVLRNGVCVCARVRACVCACGRMASSKASASRGWTGRPLCGAGRGPDFLLRLRASLSLAGDREEDQASPLASKFSTGASQRKTDSRGGRVQMC